MNLRESLNGIVTLLTDFGLADSYVAEMKGTILSLQPEAKIVDIAHEIRRHDIREGSFVLATATPTFPEGTIHIAVIDPGVGGRRRPIIIKTLRNVYIGPDNGVMILAADREKILHAYHITNPKFMHERISATFHGRDIFSFTAGKLLQGMDPSDAGPEIRDYEVPKFARAAVDGDRIEAEVIHVDIFGNVALNVSAEEACKAGFTHESVLLEVNGQRERIPFLKTYSDVPVGYPVLLIESHGFLEIAVNQGSAAERFSLRPGVVIKILAD